MKIKKITAYILVCAMVLISCSGCGKSSGDSLINTNEDAQVTYVETELSGLGSVSFFYTFKEYEDRWYVMLANYGDETPYVVKYSNNQGEEWIDAEISVPSDIRRLQELDLFIYAADIRVTDCGYEFIISYANADEDGNVGEEVGIVYIDVEGTVTKLVDWGDGNSVKCLGFSEDGESFFAGSSDYLRRYDFNGNILNDYYVTDVVDFCENGDNFVVLTEKLLYEFETETGNEIFADDVLAVNLPDEMKEASDQIYGLIGTSHKVLSCTEDDEIYLLLSSGIYKYTFNTTYIEQIVDNEKNSFSDIKASAVAYIVCGKDFYVLSYQDTGTYVTYDLLLYSEDVYENVITDTITVYSLYSSETLEEIVEIYERNNPGVEVEIEIGIEDGSSLTVKDAVTTLNTRLLAGNGPDVIILDGLNESAYQNSGYLLDISDVYEEILEEYPNCFENILSAYKNEDGIYAIPSKFKFTVITATEDEIEELYDMESLADYINKSDKPLGGNDLNAYTWEDLFYSLYPVYSSGIVSLDGEYSEEKMRDFLSGFKALMDALTAHTSDEDINEWEKLTEKYISYGEVLNDGTTYNVNNANIRLYKMQAQEKTGQVIGLCELNSNSSIYAVYSMINSENLISSNYTYKILADEGNLAFTPTMTVAVYAESANIDTAKSFVKSMFSVDEQNLYGYEFLERNGIFVNADALKMSASYGWGDIDGIEYFIYYGFSTDEDFEEYLEIIGSLDTVSNTDLVVREMIMENMEEYLNEELTIDEYMDKLGKSIDLYQSE